MATAPTRRHAAQRDQDQGPHHRAGRRKESKIVDEYTNGDGAEQSKRAQGSKPKQGATRGRPRTSQVTGARPPRERTRDRAARRRPPDAGKQRTGGVRGDPRRRGAEPAGLRTPRSPPNPLHRQPRRPQVAEARQRTCKPTQQPAVQANPRARSATRAHSRPCRPSMRTAPRPRRAPAPRRSGSCKRRGARANQALTGPVRGSTSKQASD